MAEHRGEDRPLNDAEFERVRRGLEDYDDYVDKTRGPTERYVPHEFMRHLLHKYGVTPPYPDYPWETEEDTPR